jgi:DNA-binding response OmpR family regulator
MALIVVCEDDTTTRELITAVLNKAGHIVEAFDNGLKGYERLLEGDVELLISDVQMPGKDGFALVAQVREHKDLLDLPCILLTSLQARAHMRIGMTSGADDYVTKPFQPSELMDAVNSQLKRAMQVFVMHFDDKERSVSVAVSERTNELMELFEKKLQLELQSRWARSDTKSSELRGSLLGCAIVEQEAWLALLSSTQMADMAQHFFSKVADSAALFNAEHLQFVGDGLLIAFDAANDTQTVSHTGRALKIVQSMGAIRTSMQVYVREKLQSSFPQNKLPVFAFSLVLHEGVLAVGKLDGVAGGIEQHVPVGKDVQMLSKLLKAGQAMRWPVLFSQDAGDALAKQGEGLPVHEHVDIKLSGQTQRIYRAA